MYRYETHLHTSPVSACARATVRETLQGYKDMGYAGVFITNHFIDGNVRIDRSLPYEERIQFFFSDYEEALRLSEEIGISVFCGVESSFWGTDFLIYGLDKAWYLAHPEIEEMPRTKLLKMMAEEGALIIQAHPFRMDPWIDHIRLFPHCTHGVEVCNANRSDFDNGMAAHYCEGYHLIPFAGTDNHIGPLQKKYGGMETPRPIQDEADFVRMVKEGEATPFHFVKE